MPRSVVTDTTHSPHARLRPVPISSVHLNDRFWEPRREINRTVTIPSQFEHCETTGRLDNFRRASGKKQCAFKGIYFNDSDVYKWLEAAAWSLADGADTEIERMIEIAVTEIAAAQQPDGYLNTYFMFDREQERWTNLKDMHELYCAGHLIQAAVAHHRVAGDRRLLDVAIRLADHIDSVFGPQELCKRAGACGHEEIEMALVELFRDSGEPRYLDLARYFVDARGQGHISGSAYHQDHLPFREQDRMTGHAVRHVYLCCGAADIATETADAGILRALDALWANMTESQLYVSGGIGSRYEGEAFGKDYELPNERAYAETCAAIGSVMWNWRMLQLHGDARYSDLMEWTLYNAVLPGISLDGRTYFYENPLADDGTHRRQPWFACACCPPNVARLLAALPGYFFSTDSDGIYVHLYAAGSATIALADAGDVVLKQETGYPWDGAVTITVVRGEGEWALRLRIPGWCETGAHLLTNGEPYRAQLAPGSYTDIRRRWNPGDVVRLTLPMPVRLVEAHPYAAENRKCVAITRGPLLYCAEAADILGIDIRDTVIEASGEFTTEFRPDLLGGVTTICGPALANPPAVDWNHRLYRPVQSSSGQAREIALTTVPYYAWANRDPGRMAVWLRKE